MYLLKQTVIIDFNMLYFTSLLLVTVLANGIFAEDDTRLKVQPGMKYSINNIDFPAGYKPGRSGSWNFKSDFPITLDCLIFNVPESPKCGLEGFIINDGASQVTRCSSETFTFISKTNQVSFSYYSSPNAKGGYFYCEFSANKKICTRKEYLLDFIAGNNFCMKPK